jgi:hypothetical protein
MRPESRPPKPGALAAPDCEPSCKTHKDALSDMSAFMTSLSPVRVSRNQRLGCPRCMNGPTTGGRQNPFANCPILSRGGVLTPASYDLDAVSGPKT